MKKGIKFLLCIGAMCAIASVSILTGCGGGEGGTSSKVSLSFDSVGGSVVSQVELEIGTQYTLPSPTKEGFVFKGWYQSADYSGSPVTTVTASQSATYYAMWAQLFTISFDFDGGSCDVTTVKAEAGENVYEAIANVIPTKQGLVFGAWFDAGRELSQSKKMPESDIVLTAKYKVEYTVEFYGETLEGGEYQKIADDQVKYDYVGKEVESEQIIAGFKEITHENSVFTLTLSADKSQNVFRHYYERKQITVTFNTNYPTIATDKEDTVTVRYGNEIEIPSQYYLDGYCLAGWSTSRDGEVEYEANSIAESLYNSTVEWTPVKHQFDADVVLFGVWRRGYTDMFGGNDYVFLLSDHSEVVYMSRGSKFFEGEYDASKREFTFINYDNKPNGETLITGRLNSNGTFVYYNKDKADYTCTLYKVGEGLIDTDSIQFGKADEITYYVTGEAPSTGTYKLNSDDLYEATFTDGPKKGQTIVFSVGFVEVSGVRQRAFNVRNEDEINLGKLPRIGLYGRNISTFYPLITFDGFGTATMEAVTVTGATNNTNYTYVFEDDDVVVLTDQSGRTAGVIRIHTLAGVTDTNGNPIVGYSMYNAQVDREFTLEDESKLTLDGMYNATYVSGDTTAKGFYSYEQSVFGGILVTVMFEDSDMKFRITAENVEVPNPDGGDPTIEVKYTTTKINSKYTEYYYIKDTESVYYAPMVVFNSTDDSEYVEVYGYNPTNGTYSKVLEGKVVYDNNSKLYTFTTQKVYDNAEYVTDPIDIKLVKSFVFAIDEEMTSYKVTYWYYYETEDEQTQLVNSYKNGSDSLVFVAKFAIITRSGVPTIYTYEDKGEYFILTTANETKYVKLDEQAKTYTLLDSVPYYAYKKNFGENIVKSQYFYFTGIKDQVIFHVNGVDKTGTLTSLGLNSFNVEVFKFTVSGTGEEIQFVVYAAAGERVYSEYDSEYDRSYTVGNGRFVLDGYGYVAIYYDEQGEENLVAYMPVFRNGSIVNFTVQMGANRRYFDVVDDNTLTLRGVEYGTYEIVDNYNKNGWSIMLDGYDKFTLTKKDQPDINGTYFADGDKYELCEITVDGKKVEWIGEIIDGKFIIRRENLVMTYIHKGDWSVVQLDAVGRAVIYNKSGVKEEGNYIVLTDDLLYYQNEVSTSAGIFKYDNNNGTIQPVEYEGKSYYSKKLESLQFTNYGFVVVKGTEMQFYSLSDQGDVTIYRQPKEGESNKVNDYGLVEVDFGSFDDTVEYDGVEYYANSVFGNITFANTATNYKLPVGTTPTGESMMGGFKEVIFTPAGTEEFTVTAQIVVEYNDANNDGKLTTKTIRGYVARERNKDTEEIETFILIATTGGGYYKMNIDVEFNGVQNSTYEITAMTFELTLHSYEYLDLLYELYMMVGESAQQFENSYGVLKLSQKFNEDGTSGIVYATAESFGNGAMSLGICEYDGSGLTFENAEVYETKDGNMFISFTGKDGYDYALQLKMANHFAFTAAAFDVISFTRVETLTNGEYEVKVERALYVKDGKLAVGAISDITITKNGEDVCAEAQIASVIESNGKIYLAIRDVSGNKITATTYYQCDFTSDSQGGVEDGKVVPYATVSVTKLEVNTVYTEDDEYVDYIPTEDVVTVISVRGKEYTLISCQGEDGTYTVVTNVNITYEVVVDGDEATITRK